MESFQFLKEDRCSHIPYFSSPAVANHRRDFFDNYFVISQVESTTCDSCETTKDLQIQINAVLTVPLPAEKDLSNDWISRVSKIPIYLFFFRSLPKSSFNESITLSGTLSKSSQQITSESMDMLVKCVYVQWRLKSQFHFHVYRKF